MLRRVAWQKLADVLKVPHQVDVFVAYNSKEVRTLEPLADSECVRDNNAYCCEN
jgi:hypothetical protein